MRVLSPLSWFISPLALFTLWAVVANAGLFPANLLIPPQEVWLSLTELLASGELQEHLAGSLSRLALGFTGGALAGLGFGAALALSKTVEAYCAPLFHTLRQVPSIALIPMFVLLFGVDETFARRGQLVAQAAAFKKTTDDVRAPARVEQVIAKVRGIAGETGASPEVVERVYRAMIAAFIDEELQVHAGFTSK